MASGDLQEGVEHFQWKKCATKIVRFPAVDLEKADSLRSAPYSRKTPILAAFWWYVRRSEVTLFQLV